MWVNRRTESRIIFRSERDVFKNSGSKDLGVLRHERDRPADAFKSLRKHFPIHRKRYASRMVEVLITLRHVVLPLPLSLMNAIRSPRSMPRANTTRSCADFPQSNATFCQRGNEAGLDFASRTPFFPYSIVKKQCLAHWQGIVGFKNG